MLIILDLLLSYRCIINQYNLISVVREYGTVFHVFGVHGLMYAALESYFFSSAYTGQSIIKLTTIYSTQ